LALDHKNFRDLKAFPGDEPLLLPKSRPPPGRQQDSQRKQGSDDGSTAGSVLHR
jgi:hypothetical protein